jgi:signal transduction histidine kinase
MEIRPAILSRLFQLRPRRFAPEVEAQYRDREAEQTIRYHRIGAPLGAALYLTSSAWYLVMSPATAAWVFKTRFFGVLLIAVFYLVTYTKVYRRYDQRITGCLALLFGISMVSTYRDTDLLIHDVAYVALLLIIFSMAFRLRATAVLISSLGIVAFTHRLLATESLPPNVLLADDFQLVGGLMVAVAFAWLNESHRRRTFELEVGLGQEQQRSADLADQVRSAKEERSRWLEQLAGFLRHELKNQLVGIRTSIDLAKRTIADQKGEPYLSRAHRSAEVMEHLIAAATEATSLEAAVSTDKFVPIDLTGLVRERCTDFEPIAGNRPILVSANETVAVRGDNARLVQLLDKLLGNACDHGSAGAPIHIRVATSGRLAVLEVQNEGALPNDRSHLFEPFHSPPRETTKSQNLGIGLYIANRIAKSHGGTISVVEESRGGVVVRVELPLA